MVFAWEGTPIEQMTREALEEAFQDLGVMYQRERKEAERLRRHMFDFWAQVTRKPDAAV